MGNIQAVPNLVQGVSQQAVQQRRDSQCEEQFDCINSPVLGCVARPGTELVKVWPGRDLTDAFFTEIVREDENYLIGVYNDEPFAIDLADGADCTVTQTAGNAYLSTGGTPFKDKVRSQSIEDFTFILNRSKRPTMGAGISPSPVNEAIITVRTVFTDVDYVVELSGPGAVTAVGSDSVVQTPSTDTVIGELHTAINGVNGYSSEINGPCLRIWRGDGQAFVVQTKDGNGDEHMFVAQGEIEGADKLPPRGFPSSSLVLKVRGEDNTIVDDYYVTWTGGPVAGRWSETVAPSITTEIDAASMPHTLVNTGYRTFEYKQAAWSTRIAGDNDTSKVPSFVGKRPRDIFYHSERLALLHDSGCVWSKHKNVFTYFPDTAQAILANAPVDINFVASKNAQGVSSPDFAVEVDEGLFLWAQKTQRRVTSGQDPFKQDTVDTPVSTAYEYTETCSPLALGSFLFFPTEVGPWSSLRALQFSSGKVLGDTDVTAHIPRYVQSQMRFMTAADTLGYLLAFAEADPTSLYLYNFLANAEEFLQSAWNKWRLPGGNILWAGVKSNFLRILQQRPEGVVLLRVNLTPKAVDGDAGATYMTRLDMRVEDTEVVGLTYDTVAGTSSFTLPYNPVSGIEDFLVVTRADKSGGFTRGRVYKVTSVSGAVVTVEGDLTGYKFYAGERIRAERLESEFYLRTDEGVVPVDRLTVNKFYLEMADTGYTRIEVVTSNGHLREYAFEGRKLGTQTATTETPRLGNDKLPASVGELSHNAKIRIINDSFLPSNWQAAAYEYTAVGIAGKK